MSSLIEALGLPRPRGGRPERLDDLVEQGEVDDAVRLVELQKRLDALQRDPPGAEDEDRTALARARSAAQAALSARDTGLARQALEDLAELERDVQVTVDARAAARMDVQRRRLALIQDPDGIAELPANPLKPLRERATQALAGRDPDAATKAVDALAQALPKSAEAVETLRRDQAAALGEQLLELPVPEGAEQTETDVLLPLHDAVLEALQAQQPAEAARQLALLRSATEKAVQAIDERRRQKLAAVKKRVEAFVPVEGASDAEAQQIAELREGTLEAVAGGDPQVAEAVLMAFVKYSRAATRAVQRRKAEQEAARKAEEEQRNEALSEPERKRRELAAQAARAAAEQLRAWISENIYDPNIAVQATRGPVVDTPLSDAAYETQSLDPGLLDAEKAKLAGEQAAVATAHGFAARVKAVRAAAPKRIEDLAKKIARCDTLKAEIDEAGRKAVARMGGKAEVTDAVTAAMRQQLKDIDTQKAALTARRQALSTVDTALLTSAPAAVAMLNAAEKALNDADPAPVFVKVTDLKASLTAEPANDKLLAIGRKWIGEGLRLATAQGQLNDAVPKKTPEGVFDLRLKVALAEQMKIAQTEVGRILGLGDSGKLYTGNAPPYLGGTCHVSLYKNFYAGEASWSQTADEILDQLVGTTAEKGGLHVTWEWTGNQDSEDNLKVFRNGHSNSTGYQAYKRDIGNKLKNQIKVDFSLDDRDDRYPMATAAQAVIATLAVNACNALKPRITERKANKGLSIAEKAANKPEDLKLPE